MSEFYPNYYLRSLKKKLIPGINTLTANAINQKERLLLALHENNTTYAKKELKEMRRRGKALSDRNYYMLMGSLSLTEKSLDEAISYLKEGMLRFPNDVEFMGVLANAYNIKGKKSEAIELYREALKLNPSYFPALSDLAHHYTEAGAHDEALKLIDNAIEISGDDPVILSSKARILSDMGLKKNAIEVYKLVLDLDPNDRDSLINIGNCFLSQKEYLESVNYYDKALAISPFYKDTLLMKVQALAELKKFSEAKKLLKLCIEKNSTLVTKVEIRFFNWKLLQKRFLYYTVKPFIVVINHPFTAGFISIALATIGWVFFR